MEDHLLTETTRFRQLGAHATVGSYARPTITAPQFVHQTAGIHAYLLRVQPIISLLLREISDPNYILFRPLTSPPRRRSAEPIRDLDKLDTVTWFLTA